jgi:hypothetical protein
MTPYDIDLERMPANFACATPRAVLEQKGNNSSEAP